MCDNTGNDCNQRNCNRRLKKLEVIPGKRSTDSLQKAATLGTSHIIRKVLQCETGSLSGGDRSWFKGGVPGRYRDTGL